MTVRIATVQAEATPGDLEANLSVAARWIDVAAEHGADVVVFPEAFTTGYDEFAFAGAMTEAPVPKDEGFRRGTPRLSARRSS